MLLKFNRPGKSSITLNSTPEGMDRLNIFGTQGRDDINTNVKGTQNVDVRLYGNGGAGDKLSAINHTDGNAIVNTGAGMGDRAYAEARGKGGAYASDSGDSFSGNGNLNNTVIAKSTSGNASAILRKGNNSTISSSSESGDATSITSNSYGMTLNASTEQEAGTATAKFEDSSSGTAKVQSGNESLEQKISVKNREEESVSK